MRTAWLSILVLVAGCRVAAGPGAGSPSAPATGAPSPTSSPTAASQPSTTASVTASATPAPELSTLLPDAFDGVQAHTFPVAQDLLDRLAAALHVPVESVEAAYASEHGARFIQMLAIRVPGVDPDDLLDLFPGIAYPPDASGEPEVGTATLAGRDVVVVHHPALAPRLGTFYGFTDGGVLIVVEALGPDAAEAAVAAMPGEP